MAIEQELKASGLASLEWGEIFHVGLRVENLEQAQAELTKSMGVQWTTPATLPMRTWAPGEDFRDDELTITFSVEGPVHFELLYGSPGSYWDSSIGGAGLHHFGVWVEDLAHATDELVSNGWDLERAGETPEKGYGGYAYVRSPSGILFEPESCLHGAKERFERWYAGGTLF